MIRNTPRHPDRQVRRPILARPLLARPLLALGVIAIAVPLAAPALADEVEGTVVAHDRLAHRVIMDDRTIYEYDPATTTLPRAILAGDRIRIDYRGGEDGVEAVTSIEIVAPRG